MSRNLDWKYIWLTLFFLIGTLLAAIFYQKILYGIRIFFEYKNLNICAGAISTIITVVHRIKTRSLTFSASMSFNDFRKPFEDIFSFIGNPVTIVGSLSLAKGIYLQIAVGTKFFSFNSVDLAFIGTVAIYLFFISVLELGKFCREIVTITQNNEEGEVTAIPQSEVTEETPIVE